MKNKITVFINNYKAFPEEVKASLWYTICSILQRCISFITLPLFTRLLTTAQYGQYTIYTSWMSLIAIFTTLNLQFGSFNTAMAKFEDDRDTYISAVQGICLTLTTGVFLVYLINPQFWNVILELPTILVVSMLVEILGVTIIGFWTGKKRYTFDYKSFVILTLVMAVLSPVLGLAGVFMWEEKGIAKILGNAVVVVAFGLGLFILNLKKGKKLFHKQYWNYALKFNIPLIPYYLSQMIFNQSDRIMISHMSGQDKAGIYGVAYQISVILTFVTNAINNSYVPWVYRHIKENTLAPVKKISSLLVVFVAFMLLSLIIFAPELILLLGGSKYMEAVWIIPPVTASMLFLFLSQMSINVMFYYEKNMHLVKGSIFSALVNVVLNYFCIKNFGYIAAGYTTLVSYVLFWIFNQYYMEKICKEEIPGYKTFDLFDVKLFTVISIIFLLLCLVALPLYLNTIARYSVILFVLILMIVFRKKIFGLVMMIKNMK